MPTIEQGTSRSWVDALSARREVIFRTEARARAKQRTLPPPPPGWQPPRAGAAEPRARSLPPPPPLPRIAQLSKPRQVAGLHPLPSPPPETNLHYDVEPSRLLYVQPRWFPTWLTLIAASCVVVVGVLVVHPAGDGRRAVEYARGVISALPQDANTVAQAIWAHRPRAILPDLPSANEAQAVAPSVPGTGDRAAATPIVTPLPVDPGPSDTSDGAPIEGSESAAAVEPAQDADADPAVALNEGAAATNEPAEEANEPAPARRRVVRKRPAPIGGLRLNAKPWAEVYVDGKRVGNTPQTHLELTAGRHRITLKNAEYDLRKTFSVDIEAGVTKTRIVDLLAAPAS